MRPPFHLHEGVFNGLSERLVLHRLPSRCLVDRLGWRRRRQERAHRGGGAHIGYVAHVFIPSQHAPEDIGGIPYHDTTTGFCRMVPMEWMHDLLLAKRWLFVDELTSGPDADASAVALVLQRAACGESSLPSHHDRLGRGESSELAPNGSPLEPSICNRLYHHDWVFPSGLWHEGLRNGGNFPVPAEFPVVGDFSFLLPKWGGLISGLVRNKPTLANTEKVHEGTLAFPTPRSWWNLAKCLAAAESVGLLDECRAELGAGLVGTGASAELMARVDAIAMHDVEAILSGQGEGGRH